MSKMIRTLKTRLMKAPMYIGAMVIVAIFVSVFIVNNLPDASIMQTGEGSIPKANLSHEGSVYSGDGWRVSFTILVTDPDNDTLQVMVEIKTDEQMLLADYMGSNAYSQNEWIPVWFIGFYDPMANNPLEEINPLSVTFFIIFPQNTSFDVRMFVGDVGGNIIVETIRSSVSISVPVVSKSESTDNYGLLFTIVTLVIIHQTRKRNKNET